eukprot:2264768-Alexandrium_andersonii.AAC.1
MTADRVARARKAATAEKKKRGDRSPPGPHQIQEDQHQHAQNVQASPPLDWAQLKGLGSAGGGETTPGAPRGAAG